METVRFDELDLYPQVLRAIKEMGFEEATPIQSQAIPVVMSGVDVIGQAQTGTGKTASFGIPVLHKVDPNNKKTQVIILSPTRELAIQVADEIRKLAKDVNIPAGLTELNVKEEDLPTLATNALKDACGFTNPIQATHEEIVAIFKAAM